MNESNKYDGLIKQIKLKRKIVIIITVIAVLITITLCSPVNVEILNKKIIDYDGINPVITVIIVLFIFICELIAYANVSSPMTTSLEVECDPEKHLILNSALNKQKYLDRISVVDYTYMGEFEKALSYAQKLQNSKNFDDNMVGIFNKARCQYLMGDFEGLKVTVSQYKTALSNGGKISQNKMVLFDKISKSLNLLIALSEKDQEKISLYKDIEVWNNLKTTKSYVDYLKGVAAYISNDKEEAVYRFMSVKENCSKTVFAKLSDEYLLKLK